MIRKYITFFLLLIISQCFICALMNDTDVSSEIDYDEIMRLILKICEKVHASKIFIAHSDLHGKYLGINFHSFFSMNCNLFFFLDVRSSTALSSVLKRLSQQSFFTAVTKITDIPKQLSYFHTKMNLSFLVVIINSASDFTALANITNTSNLNFYRLFLVFTQDLNVCYNPSGNPLNVALFTRSLIKCHKSPILHEWYSLNQNETIVNEFFEWNSKTSELTQLKSLNLYERRKSLDGINLRISTLKVI